MTVHEFDLTLPDGRTLHGYDTGGDGMPVMWHHGTPNVGAPPRPLLGLARDLGLRWVSFDRPGYGGSTAHSGRTIASREGVDGKRRFEQEQADAPVDFTARDWTALSGPWGWLGEVAAAGVSSGIEALIDDDVAYVTPWGVDLADIVAPVLLVHGADDHVIPASHSTWLADHIGGSVHWQLPGESHISSLAADERGADNSLHWVADRLRQYGERSAR